MTVVIIDNYDSFVHNLARSFREVDVECVVCRNDALSVADVEKLEPGWLVISPGPCGPDRAGVSVALIERLSGKIPILGVCLGHQCLAAAFGGGVVRVRPVHGRTSLVTHSGQGLFAGLPAPLTVTRYHSLAVDERSLPAALEVTARSEEGTIMALAHREHPTVGVQFHPEAVLTEEGHRLLRNFLGGVR